MNMNMKWSFYQIWNQSLEEGRKERPMLVRDKIWATELAGSFIDRYLKMNAVEPSNPPNPRSRRKFEAGNIWEAIIGYVLRRSGILINKGEWIGHQYPGLLPVSGYLDFEAGGKPNYDQAVAIITQEFSWLPEFISRATKSIIEKLNAQYPNGLANIVLEIKSCSSFMFDKYEREGRASPQHVLQLFHYLKGKNAPEGHIVYVSKDDARLFEYGVFNPSPIEAVYKADIEEMTTYIKERKVPPFNKPIVLDADGYFMHNWMISYSQYLTYLYGYKDQMEFETKYKPIVERWNRVIDRIAEGKEMTDNNKAALEEMKKEGFDPTVISQEVIEKPKPKVQSEG